MLGLHNWYKDTRLSETQSIKFCWKFSCWMGIHFGPVVVSSITLLVIRSKGVHGSGRVGFVPDLDPNLHFRVSQNRTRNRPEMLVGSAGSGRVRFSGSLVGFGFYLRCRYFG